MNLVESLTKPLNYMKTVAYRMTSRGSKNLKQELTKDLRDGEKYMTLVNI